MAYPCLNLKWSQVGTWDKLGYAAPVNINLANARHALAALITYEWYFQQVAPQIGDYHIVVTL